MISVTANQLAVAEILALGRRLWKEEGIEPHELIIALICAAVAVTDAVLPEAPEKMKRDGLHQMIDGVVLRTMQ